MVSVPILPHVITIIFIHVSRFHGFSLGSKSLVHETHVLIFCLKNYK